MPSEEFKQAETSKDSGKVITEEKCVVT